VAGGGLVEPRLEPLRPRAGRPVNPPQPIARTVLPGARDPADVLEDPTLSPQLPQRLVGRKAQLSQWYHPWIDDQPILYLQLPLAHHEAEEVAGADPHRPEEMVSPLRAGDRVAPTNPLVRAQGQEAG